MLFFISLIFAAQYKVTESGKLLAKKNPSSIALQVSGPSSFYNPTMFSGFADVVRGCKTFKIFYFLEDEINFALQSRL